MEITSYTYGQRFLESMELEIEKKGSHKPVWLHNFKFFSSQTESINWVNKILGQERSIKYKNVNGEFFALKDFYPTPSSEVCNKIVKDLFERLERKTLQQYNHTIFLIKIGNVIYTKDEANYEIIFRIRQGYENVWEDSDVIPDQKPNSNRVVYSICFHQESELHYSLKSGFLQFENKY